uniref:Uncharacterized protein n=1 Tax=Arundo donax TaxID=35708 RepID=A0A0A9EFH8_ARUDO
MAAAAAGSPTS